MPELPEVEVLVRHLAPLLPRRRIESVDVRRARSVLPTSKSEFSRRLRGAEFIGLSRRGKFLLFELKAERTGKTFILAGHLGMTGRMYLLSENSPMPRHAAVVLKLGAEDFVFEDTRYFGRLTLDTASVARLGPEPLSDEFTVEKFAVALRSSSQAIKVKLLDQKVVAGVGNIYASEALFRAGISPRLAARRLKRERLALLRDAIRETLNEAIKFGSTVPLDAPGVGKTDGLFYLGSAADAGDGERFKVYDREGKPCVKCGTPIRRIVQAARSTFYCPKCQA